MTSQEKAACRASGARAARRFQKESGAVDQEHYLACEYSARCPVQSEEGRVYFMAGASDVLKPKVYTTEQETFIIGQEKAMQDVRAGRISDTRTYRSIFDRAGECFEYESQFMTIKGDDIYELRIAYIAGYLKEAKGWHG